MNSNRQTLDRSILEELSRALLDQDKAATFVCDPGGMIVTASAAARSLLGEEPVGRPFDALLMLSRKDGSRFSISSCLAGVIQRLVEVAFERKDGRRLTLLLTAEPLWGARDSGSGCAVTLKDVTRIVAMEKSLRESEARFRRLVENARDIVFRVRLRPHLRVEYVSPSVAVLSGCSPEEFYADPGLIVRVVHPDDRKLIGAMILNDPDRGQFARVRWVRRDGTDLWTEPVYVRVFDKSGRLTAIEGIARDITDRKRSEEELRRRERDYRTLAENLPGIVYRVDVRDRCRMTFFNAMHETLTGYTAGELHHGEVCSIDPLILEEDREHVVAEVKRAIRENRTFRVTYRLRRKDDEIRYFSEQGRPVFGEGGVLLSIDGVIFDVTEQKRVEMEREALLEEVGRSRDGLDRLVKERTGALEDANLRLRAEIEVRRQLSAVIEQSSSAVAIVDLQGIIRFVNPAFENAHRRQREELVGRAYEEVSLRKADDKEARSALLAAFAEGSEWKGRLAWRDEEGAAGVLSVSLSPVRDESGRVTHFSVSELDITREVRLEESLRRKEKLEVLGTWAGGIAHDLNNILSPIELSAELGLLEVAESSPARTPLVTILEAARRGRDLVRQIVGFSWRQEQVRNPIEAGPVVREVLRLITPSLPKNVEVRPDICGEPTLCLAVPTQIHQILMNLLSNGIFAMKERGGVLSVRLRKRDIDSASAGPDPELRPGPYLELSVGDTGRGMSPDVIARMFDHFFTTKEPGEGAGIGMAVVRRIVTNLAGGISVASEPGRGTTVTVFLPRAAGPETNAPGGGGPLPGEGQPA